VAHFRFRLYAVAFVAAMLPGLSYAGTADTTRSLPADTLASDSAAAFTASPEVQRLPERGYEDIVVLQPGVVRLAHGAPIHLRGGRADELAFYVDGFSQQDPFTGLSFTSINSNTIKSVSLTPAPFSPEYGLVSSGIADLTSIPGSDRLHGTLEAVTDNFHGERSDYEFYSLVLNGPLIPGYKKLTFSLSDELNTIGNRDPGGPGSWIWLWNAQRRLDWKPSACLQLDLGFNRYYGDSKTVPRAYLFDSKHAPRTVDDGRFLWGRISHAPSRLLSFTASVSHFAAAHKIGDGVYFDNYWGYGRPFGNPKADATGLFWSWDDMKLNPDSIAIGRAVPLHTEVVDSTFEFPWNGCRASSTFVIRGDEGSVYNRFLYAWSSYIGGRFDVRSQVHPRHELLVGGEFQRHTVRFYEHLSPTRVYLGDHGGFYDVNAYGYTPHWEITDDGGLDPAKHPLNLAGYAQDLFQVDRLAISVGLRLDYFDYRTERLIDVENPLDPFHRDATRAKDTTLSREVRDSLSLESHRLTESDLAPTNSHTFLSPRLGLSFEVADGSILHASFGRYIQRPPFEDLFLGYKFLEYKIKSGGYYYDFGNPALKPEEVSSTEIGWRQRLTNHATCGVTAFYKDYSDLIEYATIATSPNTYSTYLNSGRAVAKGFEFQFEMRPAPGLMAQANYTLQQARETGTPGGPENISWVNAPVSRFAAPRYFDRRHTFTGIISVNSGPRDRSQRLSYIWERAQATVVFSAASGFPYSPTQTYNEVMLSSINASLSGEVNSGRAPAVYRFDLKADKEVPLARGFSMDIYLWVINLFNRDNAVYVYHSTGEPNNTGWLETAEGQSFASRPETNVAHDTSYLTAEQKYRLREADPANLDIPRQVRVGMRLLF